MTRFLLIRHAVNDYVKTNRLAGWTAGIHLSEDGRAQAAALGARLAQATLDQLYASPLERTMETAEAIQQHHPELQIRQHAGIGEVRYGDWEGANISELARRKAWRVVQEYPSRARFPNGETMRAVQMRIVDALEELTLRWPGATVAVVFHGGPCQNGAGALSGHAPRQFPAHRNRTGLDQQADPGPRSPLDQRPE